MVEVSYENSYGKILFKMGPSESSCAQNEKYLRHLNAYVPFLDSGGINILFFWGGGNS